MKDDGKTRAQLIQELVGLRARVDELETALRACRQETESLRVSERRLQMILESAADAINVTERDPDTGVTRLLYFNDRFVEMSGRSREQLEKLADISGLLLSTLSPEESARKFKSMLEGVPSRGVGRWKRPDGKENYFEWSGTSRKVGDKYEVVGIDRDITEQVRRERRIEHLNSVLRAIRSVNQLIAGEKERDKLLRGICRILIETRGCRNVWIAVLDESGALAAAAQAGLGKVFRPIARRLKRGGFPACARKALAESEPVVTSDPASACGDCPLAQACAGDGISMRLEHHGRIYGWLSASMPGGVGADEEERSLFKEIARDIAVALHSIQAEQERRKAEEAVRESAQRLRFILDNAYDGINICEYDPATGVKRLVFCNDRYVGMSGYTRDELMTRGSVGPMQNPHESPEESERKWQSILDGVPTRGVSSWKRPDGRENHFEWSAVAVPRGGKFEIIGIDRDITERLKMERALGTSERRFRSLTDNAFDGISLTEYDSATWKRRILYCNDRYVEMSGYSRQQLESADHIDLLQHRFEQPALHADRAQLLEGRPIVGRSSWKRPDGRENTFEWTAVLVERDDAALRVLSIDRDITERLRSERALRESEERFRMFAENAFDGINIQELDPATWKRRLLYCNDSYVEMSGYTREQLESETDLARLMASYGTEPGHPRLERLMSGKAITGIDSWKRPDGKENWIEYVGAAVRKGDKYLIFGVDRDVTERRRAENTRRRLEEQLRQAQKMEAIGQLAGGIAHDFNNLLTGILGYANILKLAADPASSTYDAAKTIEAAAQRAAELTTQLLGFARRGKHRNTPVDMHDTIGEVIRLLRRTLDRNITIAERRGAETSTVFGDPAQLQQVVLNLAVNARDAMPEGGELAFETRVVDLDDEYCRTHSGAKPGRHLVLNVSDTGCGMTAETRHRVFEPFFTTKPDGRGTGMGLAMVYGIVKNHGGSIRVYSEVDHGTTFSVYLPLAEGPVEVRPEWSPDSRPEGTGCVLVVDDEEVVRNVAEDMLSELGYTVLTASDGDEAVKRYAGMGREIDLVIIDMIMPVMAGRECFRALKEINPDVKAILATGYGFNGKAQEILEEGVAAFVQKPFSMAALATVVARTLAK